MASISSTTLHHKAWHLAVPARRLSKVFWFRWCTNHDTEVPDTALGADHLSAKFVSNIEKHSSFHLRLIDSAACSEAQQLSCVGP